MTTPREIEVLIESAPVQLKLAVRDANFVGLLILLRNCVSAYFETMPWNYAILFGAMFFGMFWFLANGLLVRNKINYFLLLVFATIPLLGLFAHSLHIIGLLARGEITTKTNETTLSIVCFIQLLFTVNMFRNMLSSATRSYVFSTQPSTEDGQLLK